MKRAVVRLPPETVHRLDLLAARCRAANPGRSCSRASVVRALIDPELAAAEQDGDKLDELARRAIRPRTPRRRGAPPPSCAAPESLPRAPSCGVAQGDAAGA